ncbi:MAG: hypothetical protein LQ347_006187, partial [Umbilicaria vellea]
MPPPFWVSHPYYEALARLLNVFQLSALDHDIRKVPSPAKLAPSSNSRPIPDSQSTRRTSTSATSQADGPTSSGFSAALTESPTTSVPEMFESPPLSAFKKKRRITKKHPLHQQTDTYARPHPQRYWNEFDDGDEAPEEEPYTLF